MPKLKRLPAYITVVSGVLFVFVLGTQTPRQGRGVKLHDGHDACVAPQACAAETVQVVNDPAGVFDPQRSDSITVDSGPAAAVLHPRA